MRQRRYILATGIAIVVASALVFREFLFAQNLPDDELVSKDLSKFLELSKQESASLQINELAIADGWSDGAELRVLFSLIPQNDILLNGGPLKATRFIKGKIYSSGSAELSYERSADGSWRLVSKRLAVIPAERKLSE
jgi:hypothetical protein